MRRHRLLLSVVLLGVAGLAFAADNYQTIYQIHDPMVKTIRYLYLDAGYALPFSAGPYSGRELLTMLEHLPVNQLSPWGKEQYGLMVRRLEKDAGKKHVALGVGVAQEFYAHTNADKTWFQGRDNWARGWNEQKPFLDPSFQMRVGGFFFADIDYAIETNRNMVEDDGQDQFGSDWLWMNTPYIGPEGKFNDSNVPKRAFLSLGGNHWSLQIGRDQLSWGNGTTGNLLVSDNLTYHDMIRFTAFDGKFRYTALISAFPHPQNYYYYATDETSVHNGVHSFGVYDEDSGTWVTDQHGYFNGLLAFMAHRFEWRMLDDKLSLAVTEGAMYMSKDNQVNLTYLNPLLVYHNNYARSMMNSIYTVEADYTCFPGLNLYSQIVLDDPFSIDEPNPYTDDKADPMEMGGLVGTTWTKPVDKGLFSLNFETAYTTPYLYLRDAGTQPKDGKGKRQELGQYGLNFVVAVRESTEGGIYWDERFMGYRWGGDALVGNLRACYEVPGKWSVTGNLFAMAHGTFDKWTLYSQVNGDELPDHPAFLSDSSGTYEKGNQKSGKNQKDAIRHLIVLGVNGAYQVLPGLEVYGQLDYVILVNPENLKENDVSQDVQLTLGCSYSMDNLFDLWN